MAMSLYSKPQKWRVREWLATGLENRGPKGLGVRIPCPPPENFVCRYIYWRGDRVAEGGSLLSCCAG